MYKLSAAGGHRPPAVCCFSRPTVGEGLAPPALRTLPCWRKFKPPSDEGSGKTAGFDGGRESRPFAESANCSPPSVSYADSSPGRGAIQNVALLACFPRRGKWRAQRADRGCLPLEGKGDRLRWMRWMYLPLISRLSATASPLGEAFFTLSVSPEGRGLLLPRCGHCRVGENLSRPLSHLR